jgi:hypothetical protein
MGWIFYHDRITFLRKDEILMSFNNSCNYKVLIVVGWVCQSKVPSSIIMNNVSVRHSQALCWFTHEAIKTVLGFMA